MEGILSVVFMLLGCFCVFTLIFICGFAILFFLKNSAQNAANQNFGLHNNQNHQTGNNDHPEIFLNVQ